MSNAEVCIGGASSPLGSSVNQAGQEKVNKGGACERFLGRDLPQDVRTAVGGRLADVDQGRLNDLRKISLTASRRTLAEQWLGTCPQACAEVPPAWMAADRSIMLIRKPVAMKPLFGILGVIGAKLGVGLHG